MTELSSGFGNSALQHLHTPIYFIYLLFCKAIFSKNVHTQRKSNFQDPFFYNKAATYQLTKPQRAQLAPLLMSL